MIGDSDVEIDGAGILVSNWKYKGISGLYDLLFKNYPSRFTEDDQNSYTKIVLATNAHRI